LAFNSISFISLVAIKKKMKRSIDNKLLLLGIVIFVLSACGKDPEPVMILEYHIDNQTNLTLWLETDQVLINESVPANTIVQCFTNQMDLKGSTSPHHSFNRFRVTAQINNSDSVLYEFNNSQSWQDWEIRNTPLIQGTSTNAVTRYYLTIPR
jgi:hypothetical protein